ncbi:hypothetical protein [Enhygromyxa salina]|uniref:Uncharacterized protein n=1 Tax=Enhygromyxa salina TaxID=215803 RepID=A0A2S9YI76_9BACT|nr:hypothetical protein [Enhygromyxa salina]PRQ04817.1 hypothetical protein ENSA7_49900 [Enhygromyxa salina]
MSDEQDPDREDDMSPTATNPSEGEEADGAGAEHRPDTEDDEDDDLEALDGDGFDRVVAQARAQAAEPADEGEYDPELDGELDPNRGERPYTVEEAGIRSKVGWGRSPIVSAAVVVVGLFLLAATWSDFRYFLRSLQSEPRDLGLVSDIYVDGEFVERYDNTWVVLEGDPDVQHAARMQGREGWIGFMRLIEADASLFVAIPRATQNVDNEFPGRFEGRMRRIDEVPQWEKLQTFFNAEELIDIVDLEPAAVVAAVAGGTNKAALAGGGEVELGANDRLRVVVAQSAAMVQLGRTTWPTREAADQIIGVLGKPWAFVEKRDTVWVYAVELGSSGGANANVELYQQLTRALNNGEDLASADPKVGGLVLPRRATYLLDFKDLTASGAELSFTYGDNTAGTGWQVDPSTQQLEPVALRDGRLTVPTADIVAVRTERPLAADPDGYLLMVDQHPRDVWPSAVMFGAVFGVVLLNGWALAAALRRRRDQLADA